jgi:hypothetical protein
MTSNGWASFTIGCGVLMLGCVGAAGGGRGPDPALRSNAALTPGGAELGPNGRSNDLRPGESAPVTRPTVPSRALAVDPVPPRGPSFQGPTETSSSSPLAPASAIGVPTAAPAGLAPRGPAAGTGPAAPAAPLR